MINLREQRPGNHTDNEFILKQAVSVMFSEPKMGGEVKYDKQIVSQILDLARNKLG
jgi:hypothetical protein